MSRLLPPLVPGAIVGIALALLVSRVGAQTSLAASQRDSSATPRAVLQAGRAAGVRLDGVLDDVAWTGADSITALTQTEPHEGAPASARTVVKVIAAGDALTIGVRADQPPGVPIISFARDRDAALANEDHIRLVLDTYLDGRSGYVFAVNPNGARYDGLVVNQGESESSDWD